MPRVRRTTLTMPGELYKEVEDLAAEEHRKPASMLSLLVKEAVESRRTAAARRVTFESGLEAAFCGLDADEIAHISGHLAARIDDDQLD
ncbi:MAG: hypothetical protein HY675_12035 [Chloroflexi bacterium]|nr:hypothetical protein [Chloroflexota bacterium]